MRQGFMAVFVCLLVLSSPLMAADIYKNRVGVAVDGYDVTAYFTRQKPRKGSPHFSYSWAGATWYFASAQARDLFKQDPQRYAPSYGGYCSNGLAEGHKVGADPLNWRIIDGRLYLFFSDYGRSQWDTDVKALMQSADETWSELKSE